MTDRLDLTSTREAEQNGWREVTLGEVADVSWGDTSTTKTAYTESGFPAYSASGRDGYLPYADFHHTGVVLSAIGANCGKTWLAKGEWSCIKNTIRFWSTDPTVDTEFLYWATRSTEFWPKRGSAQPFISQGDVRAVHVSLPPLPEQRGIAHVLGTLDDKIELNRRMNETLEEMARTLFKSWFVDFEPVYAKMEGRWHRGESLPGLPAEHYDLFPDRLVDSELGRIPEGWEIGVLNDTIEILGGGTPKTSMREYWDGGIPWYTAKDAPSLSDIFVLATEKSISQAGVENSSTKVLPVKTTVITARGTVGRVACLGIPMAMNQTCYGIRGAHSFPDFFTYWNVRTAVDELQTRTHGTIFDTITRQTFTLVEIVVPPIELTLAFEGMVRPLMGRILANLKESRALAAKRDVLLPKLLSEKMQVVDLS